MAKIYELNAFIEVDGKQKSFHLKIFEATREKEADDYFCRVHAPELFRKDKNIYGTDEKQAMDLALVFVKKLLFDKNLIDKMGQTIKL